MPNLTARVRPATLATYFFAFALPSLSLGLLLLMVTASDLMIRPAPAPVKLGPVPALPASRISGARATQPAVAWIVAGNGGVQISELLVAYEILAESGAFRIELVAPEKVLSPTTSDVSFMPTQVWRETTNLPAPALIVVPAALDPGQPEVVAALRKYGAPVGGNRKRPLIVTLSEGARLASEAGLLAGRRATSHFLALRDLKKSHPETQWLRDARVVIDAGLISSSSVAAAPMAMLAALATLRGEATAQATAARLGYTWPTSLLGEPFPEGTTPGEFVQLILHGGYDFYKRETAVWLAPGTDEGGLAATLDVLPRTFGAHLATVSPARGWVLTRHGLPLIGGHALVPAPSRPVETLILPPGAPSALPSELTAWIAPYSPTVEDLRTTASGLALDRMLAISAKLEGPAMTHYAAKMLGASTLGPPSEATAPNAPRALLLGLLWLRPILAGALGVWLVWTFRRWNHRIARSASDPAGRQAGQSTA